jgi:hypothetical protein
MPMTVDRAADDEIILLEAKPNAFLYALEATRFGFVMLVFLFAYVPLGYFKGWPLKFTTLMALFSYGVCNIVLFLGTAFIACQLVFVVTNRRAVVRFSFWGKTIDRVSIAIKAVNRIETNSYDATCGSVYLKTLNKLTSENSEDSERESRLSTTPHASKGPGSVAVPIKRAGSIWRSMPLSSPPLYGFYGFNRFDAFASLISEQQRYH